MNMYEYVCTNMYVSLWICMYVCVCVSEFMFVMINQKSNIYKYMLQTDKFKRFLLSFMLVVCVVLW